MGVCCSSSTANDYAVAVRCCPQCKLRQDIPARANLIACDFCRAPIMRRPCGSWNSLGKRVVPRTAWKSLEPKVGETIRLTPCCLYYDHDCMRKGPLKTEEDQGVIVASSSDCGAATGNPNDSAEGYLVEVGNVRFRYRRGCVEGAEVLRLHHCLFRKFSAPVCENGTQEQSLMGLGEFCNFVTVMTGEPGTGDIYESVCETLGVFPPQGLTSGDFRRMYCEFDGDLQEDYCLAFGVTDPPLSSFGTTPALDDFGAPPPLHDFGEAAEMNL
eukprot:TRINITY_DN57756_c0_g1_i1.p1 TRINITY_DN57756_c0_g1~~TRINITY_DN57756_c0_g1_i1.p1  ORF type:complete len:271 (+),score=25.43 TRINITY_DN57756_c0_g1_i1:149-961(+)